MLLSWEGAEREVGGEEKEWEKGLETWEGGQQCMEKGKQAPLPKSPTVNPRSCSYRMNPKFIVKNTTKGKNASYCYFFKDIPMPYKLKF